MPVRSTIRRAVTPQAPEPPPTGDDLASPAPSAAAVARAGSLNLVARATSGMATLALAVLTTNVLSTHGRGVYAIITVWTGIVATVITAGTPVLAADLVHGRRSAQVLHGAATAIALVTAAVLVPVAFAISLVAHDVGAPALLAAAILTVLVTYAFYEMFIAQAEGRVVVVSLTDIGLAVCPLVTSVAAAILFDATVTLLVAAWAVGALVPAAVNFVRLSAHGSLLVARGWAAARGIARRSLGVALVGGATLLCTRIDVLVVAAVISASAAGIYSIPVALASSTLLLSRSLLTATYRPIMTAPAGELAGRLGVALRHSVILVLVGGGISIPLVALGAGFVFGDAYADIWRPYALLVAASAFLCVAEMIGHVLLTRLERQRELVLISIAMLMVNGVLAAAGAAWFGLVGAAASTTIAYAAAAAAQVACCARLLDVRMRDLVLPRRSDLMSYWRLAQALDVAPRCSGR